MILYVVITHQPPDEVRSHLEDFERVLPGRRAAICYGDTRKDFDALDESHPERAVAPTTGAVHGGPDTFAIIAVYRLRDGSEWMRTLVLNIETERVTELALYRYRLDPQAS